MSMTKEEFSAATREVIDKIKREFGEDATFILCIAQAEEAGFNSIARGGQLDRQAVWALKIQHDIATEFQPIDRSEN